jgi:hypothetical protein
VETPTADQVRARSPLLRQRYPEGGPNEDDLLAAVEDSAVVIAATTGRKIDPFPDGEEVPAGLRSTAVRAVARMAEMMDTTASVTVADADARGRRLRGFSAGPYSEQYFAPGDLIVKGGRPQMSPDTQLDLLLWALATEAAKEAWLALVTGQQPPAGAVTAFDYRRMGAGYGRGAPQFGFIGGPDGF